MPIIIPYVVLLVSTYLVVAPIVDKPQWEYLYAAAFIFAGLLVYVPFVKWGYSLPFMGENTCQFYFLSCYYLLMTPTRTSHRFSRLESNSDADQV